ncbi:MAG: mobilization protein [Rhizobiales bacterium]|nr:mobilization protein [Hyphomicrobiales bacterium]
MARKTIEQRLAELEAKRSALRARLSKTERNNDMRRKVLIGSLVLHHLETSDDQDFKQQLGDWLRRELPGFLTRDNDKALFADLIGPRLSGTGENDDSGQGAP